MEDTAWAEYLEAVNRLPSTYSRYEIPPSPVQKAIVEAYLRYLGRP